MKFDILETILWDRDYYLLDRHIQRMAKSAEYFGYHCDRSHIYDVLAHRNGDLIPGCIYKVRLKLASNGQLECEAIQIQVEAFSTTLNLIALSSVRTNSCNQMCYHKTTERALYDWASRFAQENGYADIIFLNEREEITEGATSNIFVEQAGHLFTSPVHCGLLNGIYRQHLLEKNPEIQEKVLYLNNLVEAEKIYICNAVRGLRQVRLHLEQEFC